jgi:hypothetical protein
MTAHVHGAASCSAVQKSLVFLTNPDHSLPFLKTCRSSLPSFIYGLMFLSVAQD